MDDLQIYAWAWIALSAFCAAMLVLQMRAYR